MVRPGRSSARRRADPGPRRRPAAPTAGWPTASRGSPRWPPTVPPAGPTSTRRIGRPSGRCRAGERSSSTALLQAGDPGLRGAGRSLVGGDVLDRHAELAGPAIVQRTADAGGRLHRTGRDRPGRRPWRPAAAGAASSGRSARQPALTTERCPSTSMPDFADFEAVDALEDFLRALRRSATLLPPPAGGSRFGSSVERPRHEPARGRRRRAYPGPQWHNLHPTARRPLPHQAPSPGRQARTCRIRFGCASARPRPLAAAAGSTWTRHPPSSGQSQPLRSGRWTSWPSTGSMVLQTDPRRARRSGRGER